MSRLERLYSPPEIGAPGKREGRARRRDLFYAGLFVLAMGAVAIGAFALVMPGLLGGAYRLTAYFLEAKGLDVGIQVIQEGYAIGIVERVSPLFPDRDPDAKQCPPPPEGAPPRSPTLPCFRATLRIREAWPVPEDSLAQLGTAGLLQGDAVKIQPGRSGTLLADGARIAAQGRESDLMAQVSRLADSLNRVVEETIAPALASIKSQIQTIETLLGSGADQGENQERLAGAFESLRTLSANLEQAVDTKKIAAIIGSVEQMSGNLNQVSSKLTGSTQEVQAAVKQYGELAQEIRGIVSTNKPALEGTLDDTQVLLQEISASLTPILANIEDATRNLSALSRDLRRNPASILQGRKVEERAPWFK
jgi:phospholipid/cholesterol/gamma-HCH transport system substrate-binding protein